MAQDGRYAVPAGQGMAEALAAVTAQRDALQRLVLELAQPAGRQLIIVLDNWCDAAENPRHPGQLAARRNIGALISTLDRCRAIHAGLALAGRPGGEA